MKKIIAVSMLLTTSIAICADNKEEPKTVSKKLSRIISLATDENKNLFEGSGIQLGKSGNINWLSPRTVLTLALHHTKAIRKKREMRAQETQRNVILTWAKNHGANEDTTKALENALDEFFDRE